MSERIVQRPRRHWPVSSWDGNNGRTKAHLIQSWRGCGCKLGPDELRSVIGALRLPDLPPEVLVGIDTGDDATVWQVDDDRALVATLDFFTPIVDDPYDWGRIAATNAMSDVYAMGGSPFLALNIAAWPVDDLPLSMLTSVLQGGVEAAAKAGVAVLGGHSITDPEPKYGMVVLGFVHPDELLTNAGAEPGDRLFLTKPIGLGMISTAAKRGVATDEQLQDRPRHDDDAQRRRRGRDDRSVGHPCCDRRHGVRDDGPSVQGAHRERSCGAHRCPCGAAASGRARPRSSRRRGRGAPSATTPGCRPPPTGGSARFPSSTCWPTRRPAVGC